MPVGQQVCDGQYQAAKTRAEEFVFSINKTNCIFCLINDRNDCL